MHLRKILTGTLLTITTTIGGNNLALANSETIVQICNEAGVCTSIDPTTSLILTAISALVDELNKNPEDRLGENGAIMKAIAELNKFLLEGLGPNNDIVKVFKQTGIDDLLKRLGINLFGTK